jgi:putative chitinase
MLTKAQLKSIFPKALDADLEAFVSFGEQAVKDSGILQGVNRLQYFLAQLGHESNGLTHSQENLNYSAARLMAIWPNRFPTLEIAQKYDRDPEKLANFVYGGRMGNVNPGDGYKYRGRGYIQLTGREAYSAIGKIAGLDLEGDPDLASKPENAVRIACAFWTWKGINAACDIGDFTAVTKKINGGTNGLTDRQDWLSKVQTVVKAAPAGTSTASSPAQPVPKPVPPKPQPNPQPQPQPNENATTLSNNAVLEAQKKLTRLGYYQGVMDGIYNQLLRAALWSFQKDEDLPQTGRLDDRTRRELNV